MATAACLTSSIDTRFITGVLNASAKSFSQTRRKASPGRENWRRENWRYITLGLGNERLSDRCRFRLERLGVYGLSDGAPFYAYGLVKDSFIAEALQNEEEILFIEEGEPPCCK